MLFIRNFLPTLDVLREMYFPSLIYFIVLVTTLSFIYFYCCYKLNYWKRKGIQQLKDTHKIFGDFKDGVLFRTAPGYHLGNIHRIAPDAPYIGFYIFHKPCLLLKDPEIIKQILIRDFDNFPNRHFAGSRQRDSIGMVNLFGLKNPAWRYVRQKISPTLTRNKLKLILPMMMETGNVMVDYLKEKIDNRGEEKVMDIQDINFKYTADIIANVALGTKTDSFNYPDSCYSKYLNKFFHSVRRMVALVTVFFMPELVDKFGSVMLFDSTFVGKIFWNAVESREKNGEKRGDFIDEIIKLKSGDQNPIFKFEGDNLLYQSGIFFSGLESSSTATTFTIMELAKNEKYQELARTEIQNAVSTYGWTIEAFNEMKYLDCCISEGLRLHPPVSTIDRCTLQDYKIPNTDIVIEKGTPIYISLYGLNGDVKYFEKPELFNPDRFSDHTISDAYIPFGTGPRKCVGMRAGVLHAKVVISMILCEFRVHQKRTDAHQLDSRSTFTAAANGVHVGFTRL